MNDALFPTSDDALLISVYTQVGRTLDDLPYTADFERLYAAMYGPEGADAPGGVTRAELFHRLHNLRKAGRLPRLGRAAGKAVRLSPEQEGMLAERVIEAVGKLSLRDRLLYTPRFETLVDDFNAAAGLSLSPHDAWRVIAKLAK